MVFSMFAGGPNTYAARNAPMRVLALCAVAYVPKATAPSLFAENGPRLSCRRIKEQQVAFQAMKKATGNTFTAKGMPLNIVACGTIIVGGFFLISSNLYSVCNGKNKIVLQD